MKEGVWSFNRNGAKTSSEIAKSEYIKRSVRRTEIRIDFGPGPYDTLDVLCRRHAFTQHLPVKSL